jgi:hypothetical protein
LVIGFDTRMGTPVEDMNREMAREDRGLTRLRLGSVRKAR